MATRFFLASTAVSVDAADTDINNGPDNAEGTTYMVNLGQPFNQSTNLTGLFQQIPPPGGQESNLAPNYVDGVMFASADELVLYG